MFIQILKKEYIIWTRYFVNSLSGIIGVYIIFLLLFAGYKGLSGVIAYDGTIESLIVGYMVWVFSLFTYQQITLNITTEATQGTLEQLYLASTGYIKIALYRLLASFILHFIINVALLFILMLTTGKFLHLDIVSILPLLFLSLTGVAGIGLALGGLALIFKKIQSFLQLIQFFFIFLIAAPVGNYAILKIFPLSLGNELIQQVMVSKLRITQMINLDLVYLIINSFIYLALGLIIYKACEKIAMRKGLLSHY